MRVSFTFSEKQTASIESMAESLDVSKAEIVRRSLALMSVAMKEFEQGNSLAVVKDGKVIKGIVTGLETTTEPRR